MRARNFLLVDDDDSFRSQVRKTLGGAYAIVEAASESEFRQTFRPYTFDLIILDMRLQSGREGLQLLREILAYDELQPVIMVSAYGDTDAVLDSAQAGALMFLHKQEFTPELLARMVEAVLQQARVRRHLAALQNRVSPAEMIALTGSNPAIRKATELVQKAADDPECTVLVAGERGTGQELAAQVIHDRSRNRSESPFVIASGLAYRSGEESRRALFGDPRRGGSPRRKGLLEQASGGVLFFDRIERLDVAIRRAFSEALRHRSLQLGSDEPPIPVDVQLVAGTGVDGVEPVEETFHGFAEGGRLVEIFLPPVRERREDIPVLAAHFLQELRREGRTTARTLSRDAVAALEGYGWPGNLPELRNAVEFAGIKALLDESEEIDRKHLPSGLAQTPDSGSGSNECWDYRYQLSRTEVALTDRLLQQKGSMSKKDLAGALGYTNRYSFTRRMHKALEDFPEIAREFPQVGSLFS